MADTTFHTPVRVDSLGGGQVVLSLPDGSTYTLITGGTLLVPPQEMTVGDRTFYSLHEWEEFKDTAAREKLARIVNFGADMHQAKLEVLAEEAEKRAAWDEGVSACDAVWRESSPEWPENYPKNPYRRGA